MVLLDEIAAAAAVEVGISDDGGGIVAADHVWGLLFIAASRIVKFVLKFRGAWVSEPPPTAMLGARPK